MSQQIPVQKVSAGLFLNTRKHFVQFGIAGDGVTIRYPIALPNDCRL
jgi:hypothetical protein